MDSKRNLSIYLSNWLQAPQNSQFVTLMKLIISNQNFSICKISFKGDLIPYSKKPRLQFHINN
ncbi:MAG TPA: hypothetical protein DEV81_15910 [Cyanobacteria bacterium UBA11049]|nr:hypothetical protein [Cyanobacteria bacterium UBA11049]